MAELQALVAGNLDGSASSSRVGGWVGGWDGGRGALGDGRPRGRTGGRREGPHASCRATCLGHLAPCWVGGWISTTVAGPLLQGEEGGGPLLVESLLDSLRGGRGARGSGATDLESSLAMARSQMQADLEVGGVEDVMGREGAGRQAGSGGLTAGGGCAVGGLASSSLTLSGVQGERGQEPGQRVPAGQGRAARRRAGRGLGAAGRWLGGAGFPTHSQSAAEALPSSSQPRGMTCLPAWCGVRRVCCLLPGGRDELGGGADQ